MLESCEERQQCVLERKLHQWSLGGCFCRKKVRRVAKIKTLSRTISQPMVVILDLLCALGRTPRWIQFLEWRMTLSSRTRDKCASSRRVWSSHELWFLRCPRPCSFPPLDHLWKLLWRSCRAQKPTKVPKFYPNSKIHAFILITCPSND